GYARGDGADDHAGAARIAPVLPAVVPVSVPASVRARQRHRRDKGGGENERRALHSRIAASTRRIVPSGLLLWQLCARLRTCSTIHSRVSGVGGRPAGSLPVV